MLTLKWILDFFLHIDRNLLAVAHQYGAWSYGILFAILFMETGLVIAPFLPGDSLLFAAGALAGAGAFQLGWLLVLCVIAAFVGDTVNYWIGRTAGPQILEKGHKLIKKEHIHKAQEFYKKHGGFAIVLSRFVPIVRTFAPFVAGISEMKYTTFMLFNLLGGILWVGLLVMAGFFFGNIAVVKAHFDLVILAIAAISVIPIVIEYVKERAAANAK
jgi:membrane-associated protein